MPVNCPFLYRCTAAVAVCICLCLCVKAVSSGSSSRSLSSDSFRSNARASLSRVWACMHNSHATPLPSHKPPNTDINSAALLPLPLPLPNFTLPVDLERHYLQLLRDTAIFRDIKPHSYAGYSGPWIENLFISRFLNQPLASFAGLVPLFIQWTDIHVNSFTRGGTNRSVPDYSKMADLLGPLLRDDVTYVTVCQDDQGITSNLTKLKPNILVMSAGGFGHIPIPLIKGVLPYQPVKLSTTTPPGKKFQFSYELSFFGNPRKMAHRGALLAEVTRCTEKFGMRFNSELRVDDYVKEISRSKFNLAPRGFGRTSYRLAEIVQLGRIPIYLYNDDRWLPYLGSDASIISLGYSAKDGEICPLIELLKTEVDSKVVQQKLMKVHKYRHLYCYDGLLHQIELFFSDPLGSNGGLLRCQQLPRSEH